MGKAMMAMTMTRKKMSKTRLGMKGLRGVSTDIAVIFELVYFKVDLV